MTAIDKRVVQMNFDNDQFEKGVGTSLRSIDNLKKGLNFDKVKTSMFNLGDAFQSFGFQGQKAFGNLANGIGAWEVIAAVALGNIVSKAIDAGSALVKSLTIEPISLGFADYGRKLTSIQTITNSTGKSIAEVDQYFGKLDEYADKTVYNLDDMTGALAKFTNAGIDLETSVPAIKGIANMVALAGQGQQAAASAFYNLSQSMQTGFLTTMDFKSLNLANVATAAWKDEMIAGAIAAGTLTKNADGLYAILGTNKVVQKAQLFTEELSTGWASTKVMLKVFGDYGDTTTEIGKKAQAAAQDVKSWSMMMETLKASVGTGWTDTFEIMIGNLDEAKALFTPLTETIQGLLNIITDARNNLLQGFKDLGGRTAIIDTVKNAFSDLQDIMKPVFEAFKEIFPPVTAKKLFEIVTAIKALTENFKMGGESSAKLKRIFKGVFAVVDILRQVLLALAKGVGKLYEALKPTVGTLTDLLLVLADWLVRLKDSIKQSDILNTFFANVAKVLSSVILGITGFFKALVDGFSSSEKKAKSSSLPNFLYELSEKFKAFGKIGEFFSKVFGIISRIAEKFGPVVKAIGSKVGELVNSVLDAMTRGLDKLDANKILDSFNKLLLGGTLLSVNSFVNSAKKVIGGGMFATILLSVKDFIDSGGSVFENAAGILDSVKGSLDSYQKTLKSNTLMKIAQAVGLLVLSIIALTLVDQGKLMNAMAAISGMFVALTTTLDIFDKTTGGGKKIAVLSVSLLAISGALFILAGAIAIISLLDPAKAAQGVLAVGAVLGMLLGFQKYASGAGGLSGAAFQLLGLSVALLGLNLAIRSFGGMDIVALGQGLVAVAVTLGMVGVAMKYMTTGMAGASALLVASGAILVLAVALKAIGSLSMEQLGVALLGIAGALTILGIAGSVLTPVAPTIAIVALSLLAIGGAALAFGLAIGAVGAGLGSLAIGIVALAGLSSAGIAALTLVIGGLAMLIPMIATQIVKGITAFLLELYKSIPKIATALVGIGVELLKGFASMTPVVVETILTLIGSLLTSLNEHIPEFVTTGYELLKGILLGIWENVGDVTKIGMAIIREFMNAVTIQIPSLIESGYAMILAFINGLADAVDLYLPQIMTAMARLGVAIITGLVSGWQGQKKEVVKGMKELGQLMIDAFKDMLGIHSPSTVFVELAKQIVQGLANGLRDYMYLAAQSAVKMAQSVLTAVKGVFDTNSPSKETALIGQYVAQGLAKGITKFGGQAADAATTMSEKTISAMTGVASRIADAVNSNMNVNPTIRPVVDMSEITKGGLLIDKLMGNKSLDVSASLNRVGSISSGIESKDIPGSASSTSVAGTSVVFNQVNNSPKELSRIDIYRQTKNQLLQLKGFGGAL